MQWNRFVAGVCLGLLGASPVWAFRTADSGSIGRDRIQETERRFQVREHAERYRFTVVDANGHSDTGEMLLLYRYEPTAVFGVFRVLPEGNAPGATLINVQRNNAKPQLFVDDPLQRLSGEVPLRELNRQLGRTLWRLEGILDDDKNPWTFETQQPVHYGGTLCDVVDQRYDDDVFARAVNYFKRRVFIDRNYRHRIRTEFLTRAEEMIYCIELLEIEEVTIDGRTQSRTKRMLLSDFPRHQNMLLVRVGSAWNPDLPDALFQPDQLADWGERYDATIIALTTDNDTAAE